MVYSTFSSVSVFFGLLFFVSLDKMVTSIVLLCGCRSVFHFVFALVALLSFHTCVFAVLYHFYLVYNQTFAQFIESRDRLYDENRSCSSGTALTNPHHLLNNYKSIDTTRSTTQVILLPTRFSLCGPPLKNTAINPAHSERPCMTRQIP